MFLPYALLVVVLNFVGLLAASRDVAPGGGRLRADRYLAEARGETIYDPRPAEAPGCPRREA